MCTDMNFLEHSCIEQVEIGIQGYVSKQPVQRFRDIIKSAAAMGDEENTYLILAIEAQSHTHYAMPVRDMLYDAMQYTKQVENIEIIKSTCWNPPA